jgi:uncharacterized protein (TIGR03118 family)
VADNGTGLSTLYTGSGAKLGLEVTIPPPGGGMGSAPTGMVFNGTSDFQVSTGKAAAFIFATEDGTISGWNSGTQAILKVDNSGNASVYKGLAIGNNGSANFIYATNFRLGKIDVFDKNFAPVTLSGSFTDPGLPSGYAPFGINNIGGNLLVSYALQDSAMHDDVAGPGNGFVDVFDLNGNLIKRLISNGALNSPWGLAMAPSHFGTFSNDLLVGNFGDSLVNAFDPNTGAFLGTLSDPGGNPLSLTAVSEKGLWGLLFGNDGLAGRSNSLFFSAGANDEGDGIFGRVDFVPEPSSAMGLAIGAVTLLGAFRLRRGRSARS